MLHINFFSEISMKKGHLDVQFLNFDVHAGSYAQHRLDECRLYYRGKNFLEIHALFLLESLDHNSGFVFGWISAI